MTFRSSDHIDDYNRYDRECEEREKKYPECTFCGTKITSKYYNHFYMAGREYIICDSCLERDEVDEYITAQEIGEVL